MAFSLLRSETGDQLDKLTVKLTNMGGLVEGQLAEALRSLEDNNPDAARQVIAADVRVNRAEEDIETLVLSLIEHRLSRAEARKASTGLHISGEFERIGDLAKNIAKRVIVLAEEEARPGLPSILRMGRTALGQLTLVLDALSDRDAAIARAVWGGDEHLDGLYNSVFLEAMQHMARNPLSVNACTHLVFVAKNLERAGDHATNVAGQVHFRITGQHLDTKRPKGDLTAFAKTAQSGDTAPVTDKTGET